MKLLFAIVVLTLSVSVSFAEVAFPSPLEGVAQSLSSTAASAIPMPEAKGRTGSRRVGGYTSKGKGSRYVGGRR